MTATKTRKDKAIALDDAYLDILLVHIKDPDMAANTAFLSIVRQTLKDKQIELSEPPKDGPVKDILKELQDRGLPVFESGRRAVLN